MDSRRAVSITAPHTEVDEPVSETESTCPITGDGRSYGQTQYIDLILADGSRVHFTSVINAGGYNTGYLSSSAQTPWYGATITSSPSNPNGYILPGTWQLQTKDGTIYSFPEAFTIVNPGCQALVGITDRYGNQVQITRNNDANCTIAQITSPSGFRACFEKRRGLS
jgi:hypothetical protein